MTKIYTLDETTANQIAAGEVVERPVSVVKELVENSLDAGANRISIELNQGGLSFIKIVDNGCGMSPEDAKICFQRHATSKIRSAEDLNQIITLGFRGEALPSIASVAKVNLTTRTSDDLAGTALSIEAGEIKDSKPIGCPVGTTIEVKDLFFNTPARRKFLKSVSAETGLISDLISKLALARPDVRFELRSGNKILFQNHGNGSLKDTAAVIFGSDNVRSMLEINYQGNLFSIIGLISKPVLTRASRQYQHFFINGRYIKSGLFAAALQQAYQTQIPSGRFPIAALQFNLDPALVDVNVHPTKMEVRIALEKEFQEELIEAISKHLNLPAAVTGFWEMLPARNNKPNPEQDYTSNGSGSDRSEKAKLFISKQEEKNSDTTYQDIETAKKSDLKTNQMSLSIPTEITQKITPSNFKQLPVNQKEINSPFQAISFEKKGSYKTEAVFSDLTPVGQVPPTYVLAFGENGLYIIDQHAAHERVLYEKYLQLLQENVQSQMLLEPVALELSHQEVQLVIDNILIFNDLGFILEHFGGDTFLLRGVPAQAMSAAKDVFMELLDRLQDCPTQKLDARIAIDQLAAALACRDAVKSGNHLSNSEIKALIDTLAVCQRPLTCPHGRPTLININHEELKKRFKR